MSQQIQMIEVNKINPGDNDRTRFDTQKLELLAANIKANGLINPITITQDGDEYKIVAGERRFRAVSQILKWKYVSAIVADIDEETAPNLMLAENTSRDNLDPVDEANAFNKRINDGMSIEEIATIAGVSTIHVHFRLKLLNLRSDVQHLVRSGNLKIGYAQILADADLDNNRQLIATRALNTNPTPTPKWFRSLVNKLGEDQKQESLFDVNDLFVPQVIENKKEEVSLPPTPTTAHPPAVDSSDPLTILRSHLSFWQEAAAQWEALGKVFKKKECLAAAASLQTSLNIIGG